MWLQHDGCPAHYARRVRDALNELYPTKWIGREGSVSWPPRSPDIIPLDFFLWAALKNAVYQEVPSTPENMKQRIIAACAIISSEKIRRVRDAAIRRLQLCIDTNGHHFEHLLQCKKIYFTTTFDFA
ncbi:hypothetical protein WN55_11411 [Dufourea novaeangliae]|uniref:Transposable element Tc3 transposase n=1 Tax=Dufourea novaeangliae TaxID=178035 RepID=A0A154PCF7_DUFNO|nr:hypothetical protein WN55_11411 [Dufourea novaeangliae]